MESNLKHPTEKPFAMMRPQTNTSPEHLIREPSRETESSRSALLQLVLTRFREFLREPESVLWTLVFPILVAGTLGVAFRDRPPQNILVGIVGSGPRAMAATQALGRSHGFTVQTFAAEQVDRALASGRVTLLVLPQEGNTVNYRYDRAREEARIARLLVNDVLQQAASRQDALKTEDSFVSEPGVRYIDFLLPGLIAANSLSTGIWGVGYVIVEARRKRLLKRFMATPMSRFDYLASYLVMRIFMMIVEVGFLLVFGMLVFGVPLRGSLVLFVGVNALGTLTFGALGLLIASRVRTTEGASGLSYFVMLPMWVTSGIFFASSHFPEGIQPLIRWLPLTALVEALRGIMLAGVGAAEIAPHLGILLSWLICTFGLALKLFLWR